MNNVLHYKYPAKVTRRCASQSAAEAVGCWSLQRTCSCMMSPKGAPFGMLENTLERNKAKGGSVSDCIIVIVNCE